jgi:hypothetical protein
LLLYTLSRDTTSRALGGYLAQQPELLKAGDLDATQRYMPSDFTLYKLRKNHSEAANPMRIPWKAFRGGIFVYDLSKGFGFEVEGSQDLETNFVTTDTVVANGEGKAALATERFTADDTAPRAFCARKMTQGLLFDDEFEDVLGQACI